MYNLKVSEVLFTSFSIVAQYVYRKTIANISNLVSSYDMINNVFQVHNKHLEIMFLAYSHEKMEIYGWLSHSKNHVNGKLCSLRAIN